MSTISSVRGALKVNGNTKAAWWHVAVALVIFGGAVASIIWLVHVGVSTFTSLPSATSAAILTASATVLVAVITVLTTRSFERRTSRDRDQQQKRVPVYEEFVSGLLDLIGATRPPSARSEPTQEDAYAIFARFTERMIIWGSDEVVREWVSFRMTIMAANSAEDNLSNLYRLESLFLAMRRDLGLRDKTLQRGDLLRLWINDLQ